MSEMQGHTRTNVSLLRELKVRMDAITVPVNWSAVAAQAFEAKLLELESRREVEDLDDVIARLKAAAMLEVNKEYQAGLKAGRKWAKQTATPKELRRLSNYCAATEGDPFFARWWDVDAVCWDKPSEATDYFVSRVCPDRRDDRRATEQFWWVALGDDALHVEDADFLHGFGDGAVEVWDQVRDKL
jgi:hypothetical protein